MKNTAISLILLAAAVAPSQASAVDFARRSALASGHWVKVNVSQTGIHQITPEQLRQWGLDPEKTQVYGVPGVELLGNEFSTRVVDDLVPTYSELASDGRLLFYVQGDKKCEITSTVNNTAATCEIATSRSINTYSTTSTYFLTDTELAPKPNPKPYSPTARVALTSHLSVVYVEDELENAYEAGAHFFAQSFVKDDIPVSIPIQDFSTEGAKMSLSVKDTHATLFYRYVARVNFTLNLEPRVNGTVGYPTGWKSSKTRTESVLPSAKALVSQGSRYTELSTSLSAGELENYNLEFTLVPNNRNAVAYVGSLDYLTFVYPRRNRLGSNSELLMRFVFATAGYHIRIFDAAEDTRVWNVTDPTNIYPYRVSDRNASGEVNIMCDVNLYSRNQELFLAFNADSTFPEPEYAGEVSNQNLHGSAVPNMLIISTEENLPYAEELAQMHRDYQGLDVAVCTQQQVFNEFSSGTPMANAYRRLAKMYYDRDPQKFRSILFYGTSYWDNRQLTGKLKFEVLQGYQSEDVADLSYATVYTADTFFGMLSDNFSQSNIMFEPQQVAVGRLPVYNAATAKNINGKIRRYLENPISPLVATRAMMDSDEGDDDSHFLQSEEACALFETNNPAVAIHKVHRAAIQGADYNARNIDMLKNGLTQGVGFFGYSGHGNANGFAWSNALNSATAYDVPPFTLLSTCDPLTFQHIRGSIGENMLAKPDGGAIGVVGAMCSVYLPYNQYYNLSVINAWSSARAGDTFGDVMVGARKYLLDNFSEVKEVKAMMINSMCYNFCGDPEIPVPGAPAYGVSVSAINGAAPSDAGELYPRVPVTIEGDVTAADGAVVSDFNGNVTVLVYEPGFEQQTRVLGNKFTTASDVLAQATATVTDGHFSCQMVLPDPVRYGAARFTILAENQDGALATGSLRDVELAMAPEDTPGEVDLPAPQITQLYANTPDGVDGTVVGTDVVVKALIEAPAGLCVAEGKVGFAPRAILDGTKPRSQWEYAVTSLPDNVYEVSVPLKSLTAGEHTLSLSVADNQGLRADRTLTFVTAATPEGRLIVPDGAARESVTFDLDAADANLAAAHTLIIEDANRGQVFSANATFPYEWDLTDASGEPVAEGFYNAYVLFTGDGVYGSTPRVRVAVIR